MATDQDPHADDAPVDESNTPVVENEEPNTISAEDYFLNYQY
ncbi:hypothetical protein [Spirosoma areae]